MSKPKDTEPIGFIDGKGDEEMVNDSLGTVDLADTSGVEKEQASKDRRPDYATGEGKK